jgi:hypothetical protein
LVGLRIDLKDNMRVFDASPSLRGGIKLEIQVEYEIVHEPTLPPVLVESIVSHFYYNLLLEKIRTYRAPERPSFYPEAPTAYMIREMNRPRFG